MTYKKLIETVTYDVFSEYYCTHVNEDCCKHFDVSENILRQAAKFFGIKRTPEQLRAAKEKRIVEQYGSLEEYNRSRASAISFTKQNLPTEQIQEAQQKRIETLAEKYGSLDNYFQHHNAVTSKTWKNKSKEELEEISRVYRENFMKNHGVEYPSQLPDHFSTKVLNWKSKGISEEDYKLKLSESVKKTKLSRYGNPNYNNIEKYSQTVLEKYGVPYFCMHSDARKFTNDSKPNQLFAFKLDELNIDYEREYVLERYSFDFKIGDILVEINPFATHNSTWGLFGTSGKDKYYHRDKSKVAEKFGFRCIHIWDWDSIDKVIELFHPKEVIYAKSLKVKSVCEADAHEFLNLHHLQGTCKGQDICLGLYKENLLVQLMTFGKPRYNRTCDWELLRLCSDPNYRIVGGAEKLFHNFTENYKHNKIISYCDLSKFNGKVYSKLKFKLMYSSSPSKHWFNSKTNRHITDNLLRQRGADQLLGTCYGKGYPNEEIMLVEGFVEIYDCGQSTYIYSKVN